MEDPETLEETEKSYLPFIVNRCLSYFTDTIFNANEMNTRSFLDKKLQYDYFVNSLRPRKRFSKWQKVEKSEDLETVKEYFGYSSQKAKDALRILTPLNIEYMKGCLDCGGLKGKKKK